MDGTRESLELVSPQIEFVGKVSSGRAIATSHLLAVSEEVQEIVKEDLCPGSLNIVLDQPLRLNDSAAFAFDRESRMIWPALLNGLNVWVYRWSRCPLHVVEILAAVNLRQHFKLKDGDNVSLQLRHEQIGSIDSIGRLTWTVLWAGRQHWTYTNDAYFDRTMGLWTKLGAAQHQPTVKGPMQITFVAAAEIIKGIIKSTPGVGTLAKKVKSRITGDAGEQKYIFSRIETDSCANQDERVFRQIRNVLNFTKTSNSSYSAQQFPAAYHTITINGQQLLGQRHPSKRLALVPVDFVGKTVLDIGCNQGGMIHQLADSVKWAVGIDYDPHMINAANRVRNATGANNTSFYVFDLQKDPLPLISDFLSDDKVDICFLLSVCMWLDNWKEVIDFAQLKSHSMLFETNGTPLQQQQQVDYLRTKYRTVNSLAESSEDDPGQKLRKLFYLTDPILTV